MTKENNNSQERLAAVIHVAPSPHICDRKLTTRRMMTDVIIALLPVIAASLLIFCWYAAVQICVCVASCCVAEAIFAAIRRKPFSLFDFSAVITGLILAFSLPAACPIWVSVIGSVIAIWLGKMVFGGLGMNIFNPAMVGRAFVMIAFTSFIGAGGYVSAGAALDVVTHATPMTNWQMDHQAASLFALLTGAEGGAVWSEIFDINGSLGETCSIACIIGGLFLILRRTASWEIPVGAIIGLGAIAGIQNLLQPSIAFGVLHHILGGAFLLGAFFIATDPVTSPITPKGKFIFGIAFGVMVMMIRLFSNYPEGVMFSVLLINAITPLINRWTIPKPLGGYVPVKKA